MPGRPAARLGDMTAHGSPLSPGPGSPNVLIGKKPAWRGLPIASVGQLLQSAQNAAESAIGVVRAINEIERAKHIKDIAEEASSMVKIMGSTDQHACPIMKGPVADGNGVVIDGSLTVLINGLPACRMGDTIQEITSVNKIAMGEPTVLIGG
ncbi:MAG: PAAR domain-containing protein [Xenococcaceae cyanobacterium MO_207.B15]|nr:PAAR domain-containing protein [Xenococcaceae cyanobacterium MO_207.B15]MDJ0747074.1 PAAR domain-containing protein [Xenococcaceae cyanobacterium MO_167.B27]